MLKKLTSAMSRTSMTLPQPLDRKAAPAPPPPPVVHRNGSVNSTDDSDSVSGDSLEGRMDLTVVLPDGKTVRTSVEKRVPMMDLLVQVTKANKINPGGHVIHVMTERGKDFLQYKPNTAIGSLNASTIYVVPKRAIIDAPVKKAPRTASQPFETTFRLQVNLPRQQLLVLRVSPQISLSQLHQMICSQKGLDPKRYELRHPSNMMEPLDYSCTLSDYKITEINMVAACAPGFSQSTSDIMTLQREEEKKRKSFFGFMFKRSKSSLGDSSGDEHSSRGVSPARSDNSDHRSLSSSPSQHNRLPTTKIVKKRPAPPPPKQKNPKITERPPPPPPLHPWRPSTTKEASHSRHSSDSSGYHEPSNLSNSPETNEVDSSKKVSQSSLTTISSSSLNSTNGVKKRRAPPPPKTAAPVESSQPMEKPIIHVSESLVQSGQSELPVERSVAEKPEASQLQPEAENRVSEEKQTETAESPPTSSDSQSERDSPGSSCGPNSPKFNNELSSPPESPTFTDQPQDDCISSATNSEEIIQSVPPETLTHSNLEVVSDPKESYPSSLSDRNQCITLAEVHVNTVCDNSGPLLCDLPPRNDFSPDDSTISSANSDSRTNTDSAIADLDLDTSSHSLQERDGSPFISESASEIQDDHEDIHHPDLEECNVPSEIELTNNDAAETESLKVMNEDADSCKDAISIPEPDTNTVIESTERAVQTSPPPPPEDPALSESAQNGSDNIKENDLTTGNVLSNSGVSVQDGAVQTESPTQLEAQSNLSNTLWTNKTINTKTTTTNSLSLTSHILPEQVSNKTELDTGSEASTDSGLTRTLDRDQGRHYSWNNQAINRWQTDRAISPEDDWVISGSEGDQEVDIPASPSSNTSINELTASFDEVIADVQRAMEEEEEEQQNFTGRNDTEKTSPLSSRDDEHDRSKKFQSEMQGISVNFQDEVEGTESLVETPIEWVYEIPNSSVKDAVNSIGNVKPLPQQSQTDIKTSAKTMSVDETLELSKQMNSNSQIPSKTNEFVLRTNDIYKRPTISFSISTYRSRIEEENGYENKLVKSESFKNPIETLKARESKGLAFRSSSFQEKAIKNMPIKTTDNYEESQEKFPENQFQQAVDDEDKPYASFSGYEGSLPPLKELTSPSLGEFHEGKSSSMLNLAGRAGISLRRTQSDVQLSGSEELMKLNQPDNEHLRLQEEYFKLQKQLIQWQQQLLENQTLLQKQHILPSAKEFQLLDHRLLNLPVNDIIKDESCQIPKSNSQTSTLNYGTNFQRDKVSQNHSHTLPKDAFPKEYSVPPPVPRRPQRPVSFSMGSWQQREHTDSSDSLNKCSINKFNGSSELQTTNLSVKSDKPISSVEEKHPERFEKSFKPTTLQEATRNSTENIKIATYPLKETDIFGNLNNTRRVAKPVKNPLENEREAPKSIQSYEMPTNYHLNNVDSNSTDKYARAKPVITNSENQMAGHSIISVSERESSVPSVRARLSKFLELEQQTVKEDTFKYRPKIAKPEPPTIRYTNNFSKSQFEDARKSKEEDYSAPVDSYEKNQPLKQENSYHRPESLYAKNQYVPKPILPKPFSSDVGSRPSVTIGRYEESSHSDSRPKIETQSGGETKFRRQRVAPTILREDEQPKSLPQYIHLPTENPNVTESQRNMKNSSSQDNRLPTRENFQNTDCYRNSEATSKVRQPNNGTKSVVYFSDSPKSTGYPKSESISAVRKVAENSVMSKPNLPIGLMTNSDDELDFRTNHKPVTIRQNGKTHSSGGYTTVVKLISPVENSVSSQSVKVAASTPESLNPPPPPPPVLPAASAKPVIKSGRRIRQLEPVQDPRDVLLNAIRDFGGRDNLRKVPRGETGWKIRHGGLD